MLGKSGLAALALMTAGVGSGGLADMLRAQAREPYPVSPKSPKRATSGKVRPAGSKLARKAAKGKI